MKHLELAKKLKALADKGIGGEKVNAEKMLNDLLEKHKISIDDIEQENTDDYFFILRTDDVRLFVQIVKKVNRDLKVYGEFPSEQIKEYGLEGNYCTNCTAAEFIEIKTMFEHYLDLYNNELDIFFGAFLTANNLLIEVPKDKMRSVDDLTLEEKEKWLRQQDMASKIRSETLRKRLNHNK